MTIPILKLLARRPRSRKPMDWQVIFELARVNGGHYDGEQLPPRPWQWPRGTYLDRKLRKETPPCLDR